MNKAEIKNSNDAIHIDNPLSFNLSTIKNSQSITKNSGEFASTHVIEDYTSNIESMNEDEIIQSLKMLKLSYEKKLKEVEIVHNEIKQNDDILSCLDKRIITPQEDSDLPIESKIPTIKKEINKLRRGLDKKLRDVESKTKAEHSVHVENIQNEYDTKFKHITEENDKTIKIKQDIVNNLRSKLEHYERNPSLFMTRKAHEEILARTSEAYQNEISLLEKEIEHKEKFIKCKTNLIHIDTIRITESDYVGTQNNEAIKTDTNDLIGLINQLETFPQNETQGELEKILDDDIDDEVPINQINNLSMSKGLMEEKERNFESYS